jgi:uncharacterized protein involved in exopolysaccharide biosynthesis
MTAIDHDAYAVDAPQEASAFSLRDVLTHGFYNKRLVITCIGIGAGLGLVGALLSPPHYTAEALLQVLPPPGQALASAATPTPDQTPSVTQAHLQILQSNPVIEGAVRRLLALPPSAAGPIAAPAERAVVQDTLRFKKKLHVSAEPSSDIIRLTYTASRPEVAAKSLEALIASAGSPRPLPSLDPGYGQEGDALRSYGADLQRSDEQIRQLEARHGVIDINQDIALANTRLDNLTQRLSQAQEHATTTSGEAAAAQGQLAATPKQVFESHDATNVTSNDDARNTLLRLRQDRAHLATRYSPEWGGLKELDAKIAAAEAQLSENAKDRFFTDRSQRNPLLNQLDGQLATASVESHASRRTIRELESQADQARARIAELRDVAQQIRGLQRERDLTDGIYRQLSLNQSGAALRDQAGALRDSGFRVIQPPEPPLKAQSLGLAFLVGGLLLGCAMAAAASTAVTLARPVFITPAQASRALRLPALADFDAPHSNFLNPESGDAVGRFATLLMDAASQTSRLKVILISAPDAEGKSDFALALGRTLASDYRRRTLVVDFDALPRADAQIAHQPHIRLPSNLPAPLNFGHSAIARLWLAMDPHHVSFSNPRVPLVDLKVCLDAIRPHFDHILVVGQKEFGQYAARRLYALADASILIVRAEKTRLPAVRQLKEIILASGGNILGFVFTFRDYYIPERLYKWL